MKYNPELLESIPTTVKLCAARTEVTGGVLLVGLENRKTYSIVVTDSDIRLGSNWKAHPKLGIIPFDQVVVPPKPKTKIMPLGAIIPFRSKKG